VHGIVKEPINTKRASRAFATYHLAGRLVINPYGMFPWNTPKTKFEMGSYQ